MLTVANERVFVVNNQINYYLEFKYKTAEEMDNIFDVSCFIQYFAQYLLNQSLKENRTAP